jgi:hypothetical protein
MKIIKSNLEICVRGEYTREQLKNIKEMRKWLKEQLIY